MDEIDEEVTLEEQEATGGPLHWPTLEGEDLAQAQVDLTVWVEALVDRFELQTKTVPRCWNRHNNLIEALQALRDFERGSFCEGANPTQGVDFLRALRDVVEIVGEWVRDSGCTSTHCENLTPRTWSTDPAGWDDRAPLTWHVVSA